MHMLAACLLVFFSLLQAVSAENSVIGDRLIAIDFNQGEPGTALTQGGFRAISGPSNAAANSGVLKKSIGRLSVEVSTGANSNFEFRAGEVSVLRTIPGSLSTLPLLLADSVLSRTGGITIRINGLEPGWYLFRSYHFEPSGDSNLGRPPSLIGARIGGELKALVTVGSAQQDGVSSSAERDVEIPVLTVPFRVNADESAAIVLSSLGASDAGYVFLNGFEVFAMP